MSMFRTKRREDGKVVVITDYLHPRSVPRFGRIRHENGNGRMLYGTLSIRAGFVHDGCSGPTRDDSTNKRACGIHDWLYSAIRQLIELGEIKTREEWEYLRKGADDEFRFWLKRDGMPFWRRWYYYRAVRWFGEGAMLGEYKSKVRAKLAKVCVPGLAERASICAP